MEEGVLYRTMVEGIAKDMCYDEKNFGVHCQMIDDIPRFKSPASGIQ